MNKIRLLTAEFQKNSHIYKSIENFYTLLQSNNWVKNYVLWELDIFKMLGYDLELINLVEKKKIGNMFQYISKSLTRLS